MHAHTHCSTLGIDYWRADPLKILTGSISAFTIRPSAPGTEDIQRVNFVAAPISYMPICNSSLKQTLNFDHYWQCWNFHIMIVFEQCVIFLSMILQYRVLHCVLLKILFNISLAYSCHASAWLLHVKDIEIILCVFLLGKYMRNHNTTPRTYCYTSTAKCLLWS